MEQEGNLLESVTADAALANEWSLPVLPEGVGHLTHSTKLSTVYCTTFNIYDNDL